MNAPEAHKPPTPCSQIKRSNKKISVNLLNLLRILLRLILHPLCLVAGIGCNRGTEQQEILDFIKRTFNENDLALESLSGVSSIDAKRDEKGLIEAARSLGIPVHFFSAEEIKSVEVPHPSGVVKKHMGVSSVCEATAILKSQGGRLLVPKTKSRNVTLAVALEI